MSCCSAQSFFTLVFLNPGLGDLLLFSVYVFLFINTPDLNQCDSLLGLCRASGGVETSQIKLETSGSEPERRNVGYWNMRTKI